MTPKPKIQYIDQFYIYGSEAQALQQKEPVKKGLQLAVLKKMEKLYLDPVALVAIALSVFLLVVMVLGVLQLQTDWAEYQDMVQYLHDAKEENRAKVEAFRDSFDRGELRAKAESMGLVPKADVQHRSIAVTPPQPKQETTFLDQMKWLVRGLFA